MGNPKRNYKLKKGDTLIGLAKKYKLKNWRILWTAPENRKLKQKRKEPEELQAGDVIFIPVTPAERKAVERDILAQNLQRNLVLEQQAFLREQITSLKYSSKVLATYIGAINKSSDAFIVEINKARKGIKNWSTGVDTAALLINLSRSLAQLAKKGYQASKASGKELEKINAEVTKAVKKKIFGGQIDAARKTLVGLKDTRLGLVHVLNESFNKLTSPSFWAMTWVQYYKEGKSWSDAVTYDVNEDFDKKIATINRDRKRYVGEIKVEIAKQKKTIALLETHITMTQRRIKEIEDYSVKLMEGIE